MATPEALAVRSFHDEVVSLIAQRWAKSFQCKVAIRPAADKHGWLMLGDRDPDIVGWQYSPDGNRIEWIAEVETDESLCDEQRWLRWNEYATVGVPFYLFVPRGYRTTVQHVIGQAGVPVNGIYEYALVNDAIQLS